MSSDRVKVAPVVPDMLMRAALASMTLPKSELSGASFLRRSIAEADALHVMYLYLNTSAR